MTVLVLLFAVVGGVSYLGWRQSVPGPHATVTLPGALGHNTRLALTVEASRGELATVEVRLVQRGQRIRLLQEANPGRRAELTASMQTAAGKLHEGHAVLEVRARDTFWRPLPLHEQLIASLPVTLDLTPPKLEVLAASASVAPGGAGVVVARATGAARVETQVGELTFPTFTLGDDPSIRVGLIALPHDVVPGTRLSVIAHDEAGNRTVRGIPSALRSRRSPRSAIELSDPFLEAKVPELLPRQPPAQSLLEGFLVINRDHRREAEETKRQIGGRSGDASLWRDAFLQPRNSKVVSTYGEIRTYRYRGQDVDTQVHLGYDLASTRHAPVPAANDGVVVFAGPVSIYGNTLVVDHGLGLMTLYAHLSSLDVATGDRVEKGQPLGRTGTTGLAVADHLHYEVLVHGLSVTPLEWWDARWIRDTSKRHSRRPCPRFDDGVGGNVAPPSRAHSRGRLPRHLGRGRLPKDTGDVDVITHALAGGLVARATVVRASVGLAAAAVGGAVSPDVDVVARLWDPMASVTLHRGPTHSLLGGVVLALAVATAVRATTDHRFWRLAGLAYLGVLSHLLLDLFTPFGTAVLWPFDPTRRSVGSLHVIDPVVTLVILGGLLPAARWRRSARAVARLGLLGVALYVLVSSVVMQVVQSRWTASMLDGEAATGRTVVVPSLPGPVRWLGVAETSGGIVQSRFWLWQVDRAPRTIFTATAPPPDAPDVGQHPAVVAFRQRAAFVQHRTTRVADGWVIEYEDLAFEDHPLGGPMVLRLRVEPWGTVRRVELDHRL